MKRKDLDNRIFPSGLPYNEWVQFEAEGFTAPVCGVIYRCEFPPSNGMPLGGIDTGCLDLEADGTFGYCTIFNSHVPRRGPLNLPFLGLNVNGRTTLLARDVWPKGCQTILTITQNRGRTLKNLGGVGNNIIGYWGHYPVADLEYGTVARALSVGLRAWAPFLPGDIDSSMIPAAVFEVHLRNLTDDPQHGTLVFSFPGPSREEAEEAATFPHKPVKGLFSGITVTNGGDISYALGVVGDEKIRLGGELGTDGEAWVEIADHLPEVKDDQPGASVAVDFSLNPRENKAVRFILSWYSPRWKGGGTPMAYGNTYTHMYSTHFQDALEAAQLLAEKHESLLKRILAWQQVIYTDEKLPGWLQDSLINILHTITEDGMWAVAKPPIGGWCREEDGLFGMNPCPRGCPHIECLPISVWGNTPIVYFFPKLALSTLRGYKAYQFPDGAPTWHFGGYTGGTPPCEMVMPTRGYQFSNNGICYVSMVDRYLLCTGDDEVLKELYESVKKATVWTMNLRPDLGPDGIISVDHDGYGNDWNESCEFYGLIAQSMTT